MTAYVNILSKALQKNYVKTIAVLTNKSEDEIEKELVEMKNSVISETVEKMQNYGDKN